MKIVKCRAGDRMDSAPWDPPPSRSTVNAQVVAGVRSHAAGRRFATRHAPHLRTRASAPKLERQGMTWITKVFLLAGGLTATAIVLGYAFGFGWYSLIAGLPTFIASSVLVPFFLVVRDQRLALKRRLLEGKRRRKPRRRISGPAPAVSIGAQAPSAERGGRVLAALPAAPL
jgi:hypothetical protein